jgi:hypothetical protein
MSVALVLCNVQPAMASGPTRLTQPFAGAATPRGVSVAPRSLIDRVRKVASCALHIAAFVVGNTVAVSKLRKAGGVWKVAKRTWRARTKTGKLRVLSSVFGELIGLNTVVDACT